MLGSGFVLNIEAHIIISFFIWVINIIGYQMKECILKTCNLPFFAKGFCQKHYQANYRHGEPVFKNRQGNNTWEGVQCSASDCERDVRSKGLCAMHYTRDFRLKNKGIPRKNGD